jgi:hypothetical protein
MTKKQRYICPVTQGLRLLCSLSLGYHLPPLRGLKMMVDIFPFHDPRGKGMNGRGMKMKARRRNARLR